MSTDAPTIRILFVDDEPAVLGALQNLLRRQRRTWDMRFALGGPAALEELASGPFDVVVSDLRMPGMDGAALLAEVRRLQPAAVRIVLSGHAERDIIMRALSVAHRYLSKPCEADELRQTLEHALNLQRALTSRPAREAVGQLSVLPSVPVVVTELGRALAQPSVQIRDLVAIVERDPALSLKVFHLANSGFFGPTQRCGSIADAVSYVGVDALRRIVATAVVAPTGEQLAAIGTTLEDSQRHALEIAAIARALAPENKRDAAYTAALLHDIGHLVLTTLPGPVRDLIVGDVEHAAVGAYLLGLWGLPCAIVQAVAAHHNDPADSAGECSDDLATIVHAAHALAHDPIDGADVVAIDDARMRRAGVTGRLTEWVDLAKSTLGLMQAAS